jgi:rod shape-determining protein MreC
LEGDNSNVLRLSFLSNFDEVKVDDRVMTSGHGGIFPAGIPVGAVVAVEGDSVSVAPLVAFGKLEFVQVLRFNFPEFEPVSEPDLPAGVGDGEAGGVAKK